MTAMNPGAARPEVTVLGTGIMGSAMARNLVAAGLEMVKSVMFSRGVADALPEGCVWAQMGTIGVAETLGIRGQLAAARPGVLFVDAPGSGSKGPAEQAEMCQHQPQCPDALAPDHQAARAVATHPEQGW